MRLGCEWRHARKRWAEIFDDFEKAVSWDFTLGEGSPVGGYGMRSAFVGSVSWDLTLGEGSPVGGYGTRSTFIGSESWDFDSGPDSPVGGWLWAM